MSFAVSRSDIEDIALDQTLESRTWNECLGQIKSAADLADGRTGPGTTLEVGAYGGVGCRSA